MRLLVTKGSEVVLPYLLEAARGPRSDARSLACQLLVEVYADPAVVVPVLAAAAGDDRDTVRLETARDVGRMHAYAAMSVRSGYAAPGLTSDLKANSLETLSRLLKDRASEVRAAAAEAHGEFAPDPAATAGLVAK
jgi:HEAT repeat protein